MVESANTICVAVPELTPVVVMRLAVVETVPPTVHVRERVAVFAPVVVGFARATTVQVPPPEAISEVLQLSVTIEKSVVLEMLGAEHPLALAVPEFVRVNVTFEEFDPTTIFPYALVSGDQASEATLADTRVS